MRSPRASARRKVLAQVKVIKSAVTALQWWWTAETTVYGKQPDGSYSRERRLDEYPEMQRQYWMGTINECDELITKLLTLRELCYVEYHATPPEKDDAGAS